MIRNLLAALLLPAAVTAQVTGEMLCACAMAPPSPAAKGLLAQPPIRSTGRIDPLVIYTRFRDGGSSTVPAYADRLFDEDLPGSFAHYYSAMSFGQFRVRGTVLPTRYASNNPPVAYLSSSPGEQIGAFGRFVQEVLEKVDGDVDLARFDNDGPDGRPGSGDDDGVVDYVFIVVLSVPRNFLNGPATGVAGLGFDVWESSDADPEGRPIQISGHASHGSVLEEGTFSQTVGVMAHEFGHGLGLPDLYDLSFLTQPDQDPAADGAGIGKWGLMGWGAWGWNGDDGPVGMSAWSRLQLGWLGPANSRLREITLTTQDVRIADLHDSGHVYRVVSNQEAPSNSNVIEDYLLLEHRRRDSNYYNRSIPADGLLVWHVRGLAGSNADERKKVVDLLCADGLYEDAGFPLGRFPVPRGGRDNLDFWAHDAAYALSHGGNQGDATDPFDGRRYTSLGRYDNPSSNLTGRSLSSAETGVWVRDIRPEGNAMRARVSPNRWAGTIRDEVVWAGTILVDGDLTVAPEGRLTIRRGTVVRLMPEDRLRAGEDPDRIEVRVNGRLDLPQIPGGRGGARSVYHPPSVVFEPARPGGQWQGLFVGPAAVGDGLPDGVLNLRGALRGLVLLRGNPDGIAGLLADGFQILDLAGPGTAGNGDGRPGPGETFRPRITVRNGNAFTQPDIRVRLTWDSPALFPARQLKGSDEVLSEPFSLSSGESRHIELPALVLDPDTPSGSRLRFEVAVSSEGRVRFSHLVETTVEGTYPDHQLLFDSQALQLIDETVLLPPDRTSGIGVRVTGEIASVDLLLHSLPGLGPVSTHRMSRLPGSDRTRFRSSIRPPRGRYQLSFRVTAPDGRSVFSPFRLTAVALADRSQPVLVIVDEQLSARSRGFLIDALTDALGEAPTLVTGQELRAGSPLVLAEILSWYRQPDRFVVWLTNELEPELVLALERYLDEGGRLLVTSRLSGLTPESARFLRERLGVNVVQPPRIRLVEQRVEVLRIDDTTVRLPSRSSDHAARADPIAIYVGALGLTSLGQPLFRDTDGSVSAAAVDAGVFRTVFLPVSLHILRPEDLATVLVPAVEFLLFAPEPQVQPDTPVPSFEAIALPGDLSLGNGAGFWDYDGDGDLDLYLTRVNGPNRLLRNDGGRFSDVATYAGVADPGFGRGLAYADYDGDGDLDLYVVNEGYNRFYENSGDGRFWLVGNERDLDPSAPVHLDDPYSGRTAAFFDYDGDGDLDLYVTNTNAPNRLFHNHGGSFVDRAAVLGLDDEGRSKGLALADYDQDGDLDVFIANDGVRPSQLYRNDRVRFTPVSPRLGVPDSEGDVGALFVDHDGDGDLDLFVSNQSGPNRVFLRQERGFTLAYASDGFDIGSRTVGMAAFDYDNDGDQDLFTTALAPGDGGDRIYTNRDGRLETWARLGLRERSAGRGVTYGDYDGDGRLDVFVADNQSSQLYRNTSGANHWIGFDLEGSRLNPQALGARVEVVGGDRRQLFQLGAFGYCSQVAPSVHVGLGATARVDSLYILWPDGRRTVRTRIDAGEQLVLVQPRLLSSPKPVQSDPDLRAAYPNPFNSRTVIPVALPTEGIAQLHIYDSLGQRVATLLDTRLRAGTHLAVWDGRDAAGRPVASGVYIARLSVAGGRGRSLKVVLMR